MIDIWILGKMRSVIILNGGIVLSLLPTLAYIQNTKHILLFGEE